VSEERFKDDHKYMPEHAWARIGELTAQRDALRALVGELVDALAYSVEHLEIAHEPPACHKCSDLTRDEHYELIARARAALKGGA
jgi:hypothetical protein